MKLTEENIRKLAGETNRQTVAAVVASLLSMVLVLGAMGVGLAAVFALSGIGAFVTGFFCLSSVFSGGIGVGRTYRLLYEGEWEPDKVKKDFNLQAVLALASFFVLILALII
jgi:hypothetical protein